MEIPDFGIAKAISAARTDSPDATLTQGDRVKAVEHYRKVIGVWKNADPELQVIVNELKARVRRLTDLERTPR